MELSNPAAAALRRLVADRVVFPVELGPIDLIVVIGYLQLAMKHPSLTPLQLGDARALLLRLARPLVDREPALGAIVDAGFERTPAYDRLSIGSRKPS